MDQHQFLMEWFMQAHSIAIPDMKVKVRQEAVTYWNDLYVHLCTKPSCVTNTTHCYNY